MSQGFGSRGITRREALGLMGMTAAAAAWPAGVAAAPTFPKGAVIRTILKAYAPEDLAGAATLFHEHMSFASDFMTRWNGYAAETRAAQGGGGAGARGGGGAGRAGGAPPAAPAGPFFMQDVDLMAEEMSIAKREGI